MHVSKHSAPITTSQPIGLSPGADPSGAGQDARKYDSTNPVVAYLVDRWIHRLIRVVGPPTARYLDVGVGEGRALARMQRVDTLRVGLDYRLDKLRLAVSRNLELAGTRADAGMLPFTDASYDLVLCIEVLEHLVMPTDAIAELARVTRGRCVVSVPWEPWFRAGNALRGKNVRRAGNDPEHVQQYSPARLRDQLELHFEAVDVKTCFPWLIAVASHDASR
jgi:SAM-dependent methyltransferase